ncbi:unnamed protein product [Pseudo-nitzschia multistriata]|uniref:Uncharacterized protein n=1 Tax=Pseudo-nitzschia multistriata TaxID=183589 RepID=A0A448ZPJ0_9STRA|nr:unnamed protein product [Pseudo-nitzschia multistriata]
MDDSITTTITHENANASADSAIESRSCTACPPSHTNAKASPSHLYAQQLNNTAALCIEIGHYSRAISSLQKALELNRNQNKEWKDRNQPVCRCYKCTLDACIYYSENTPSEATVNSFAAVPINSGNTETINDGIDNKRRKVCLPSPKKKADSAFWKPPSYTRRRQHQHQQRLSSQNPNVPGHENKENIGSRVPIHKNLPRTHKNEQKTEPPKQDHYQEEDDEDDGYSGGYIYRRPIRVICEGHAMGSTLYLIITFNLALANHLLTISSCYNGDAKGGSSSKKLVNRTLALYQLTYKWQLKLLCGGNRGGSASAAILPPSPSSQPPSPSSSSPQSCTAVTSIRFNMIIRNNLSQIHRLVGNHEKHKRCLQFLLSTVMVVTEYKSRTPMNRVISNHTKDPRSMELDGFLRNTTAIILQKGHCANAA